jgi:hypothetical protein
MEHKANVNDGLLVDKGNDKYLQPLGALTTVIVNWEDR